MTNGRIDICPIALELPYSNVGDIRTSTPEGLLNIQPVEAPCTTCRAGTRHMIRELEKQVPFARCMIEEGVLDAGALDYPEINNSCEIIP